MHHIRIVCLTNKCIILKQKVNVLKTHYYKYTVSMVKHSDGRIILWGWCVQGDVYSSTEN